MFFLGRFLGIPSLGGVKRYFYNDLLNSYTYIYFFMSFG